MKKKAQKFTRFIQSSNMVNYRDTSVIGAHYNKSIHLYQRFDDALQAGDEDVAADKLRDSGTILYQTCEWALKNYLDVRYKELKSQGIITEEDKVSKIDSLSKRISTLKYLLDEFKENATPDLDDFDINCEIILRNANLINNKPKHEGKIPNPEVYRVVANEIRKIIKNFVDGNLVLEVIDQNIYGKENGWYEIAEDTNEFADIYSYILIKGQSDKLNSKKLFSVKWDLIIDMDSDSDLTGLCADVRRVCMLNPWIRTLKSIDTMRDFTISNSPYWVMANGSSDDTSSLVDPKKWKGRYGRNLINLLEHFHSVYTKPAKVFIVPFNEERNLERIVEVFNDIYMDGDEVDFCMVSPDQEYNRIDCENFKKSSISIEEFCERISFSCQNSSNLNFSMEYILPSSNNQTIKLTTPFFNELLDSFEVIHENIAMNDEDDVRKTSRYDFYSGESKISWYGLKNNFDVIRKDKNIIYDKIILDMQERGRYIKKVCYEPGIGGSTLMRRLAWELRVKFPTLILNQISEQTVKNVQKIYDLSKLPILIFVDSNSIEFDDVYEMQSELKKMGFAFLICYFERKLKGRNVATGAIYTIVSTLGISETNEMKLKLREFYESQDVEDNLSRICNSGAINPERSPFIMSLYTFDKDFKGIKPYISNFMESMNDQERKVLFAIALSDYGNSSIDLQYFIDLFDDQEIEEFLITQKLGIHDLVKIEKNNGKSYLRIRYHLFAEEILCQMSGGKNQTNISFNSLIDDILRFIDDSRKNYSIVKVEIVELLRKLFITRVADADSSKPSFSPLISKLKDESKRYLVEKYDYSNDAMVRIFNKLVEVYPEEHHFTAHLARYYFYIDQNYDKGFTHINKAIDLSKAVTGIVDPLLYHMKAMGYSSRITNEYIPEIYRNSNSNNESGFENIILNMEDDAKEAFKFFEFVRESNIGVAGHISDINLCIQISNVFKNLLDEKEEFNEFLVNGNGHWLIKYIDRAKNLFDECKKMANGENIEELENRLNALSASVEESISIWKNFLSSPNCANKTSIRRMLARTITRANNNIEDEGIYQENLKTIIELMEDNMLEEEKQSGNIRIWFESIMKLKSSKNNTIIMDAIIKLNRWIAISDDIEAHYYRFVLKFLQAKEGSSLAQEELPKLIREMKGKSINLYNRTSPRHWFTNNGEGLHSLMVNRRSKKESISEEQMAEQMVKLVGRVSTNYVNNSHAYINYRGVEIFFNPLATKGEIDKSKINQRVKFGIGFSYDGPRAYNSSIKLLGGETDIEEINELEPNVLVKCEVLRSVEHYVQVRIIGYEAQGSIHVNELIHPFTVDKRPQQGSILDLRTINIRYDNKAKHNTWMLTMNIEDSENELLDTDIAKQLKALDLDVY